MSKGGVLLKRIFMMLCLSIFLAGCQNYLQDDLLTKQTSLSQNDSDNISNNQNQRQNKGDEDMGQLIITIDNQDFSITLEDNETVKALLEQLPMTMTMEDLHGNEKYYYFNQKLPMQAQPISHIEAGDFMLFGSDCLVIFYESFSTSYSYTRLGHVDDVDAFMKKVGSGSISVTIHQ